MFPHLHLGRPWFVLVAHPVPGHHWASGPTSRARCPGTCSPSPPTLTVSFLFWYLGLIPDLATLRDAAPDAGRSGIVYGIFALGWRGSARALAALPDRLPAPGRPGHAAGALGPHHRLLRLRHLASCPAGTPPSSRPTSSPAPSSRGFAMVVTLMIPARKFFGLEHVITDAAPRQHGQGDPRHRADGRLRLRHGALHRLVLRRTRTRRSPSSTAATGPYAPVYWHADLLQRAGAAALLVPVGCAATCWCCSLVAILVNVGMWAERFVIIAVSLHRDFIPSSWAMLRARPGSTGACSSARSCTFGVAVPALPALPPGGAHVRGEGAAARAGAPTPTHAATRGAPGSADAVKRYVLGEFAADRRRCSTAARALRGRGPPRASTSTRRTRSTAPTRRSGCGSRTVPLHRAGGAA